MARGRMLSKSVNRVRRRLASSQRVAEFAAFVRNQCEIIIGYHFAPSIEAAHNGEGWLITAMGGDIARFIDVGANIGDWTADVLVRNPSAEGIAVEPGTAALSELRARLQDSVEVVPAAAGAQEGTMPFYEAPDASQESSAFAAWAAAGDPREVDVVTVDGLLHRFGWDHVDLLKIDTEGYDALALAGAEAALRDHRIDVVQFEYNRPWREAGRTLAGVIGFLEGFGYQVYVLRRDRVETYDYARFGEFFGYSNFVAVNPASAVSAKIKGSPDGSCGSIPALREPRDPASRTPHQ